VNVKRNVHAMNKTNHLIYNNIFYVNSGAGSLERKALREAGPSSTPWAGRADQKAMPVSFRGCPTGLRLVAPRP
jgi:hypothetical protein